MKKIIFFAYDLSIGGIEKSLINLLNELIDKYEITLVLENNSGLLKKDLSNKIKIIEYKISTLKFPPMRKIINYLRRLKFILKHRKKYDFSCAFAPYLFSAVKLSRICSKNNAMYVHSDYSNIYNESDFKNFFNKRNIDTFKKIIFVSNQSKSNFIKYYPNLAEKCTVINNIVNIKEIENKSKEKINIKTRKEDIIFTFVGRLEEESKKISRLLNVFKILIQNNENIVLWIIGNGPVYSETKKFIKENRLENNIIMMGFQDNPYKYMKNSNYLILTSDYEGFPVVFNEAAMLSIPIFSTLDISDDYYDIKNGYGVIIPKDPELIAKEIVENIDTNIKAKSLDFNKINEKRLEKIKEIIENEV